jgi:hypothetical protein
MSNSNNLYNPYKVTSSEQRRPIAKLKLDQGDAKPTNPSQPSSSNEPSPKNNNE